MFWRKCGKVISDGAGIVRCDRSPCPYYAIFGFKYRYLRQDTMEPYDNCTWYFDVGIYAVDQGKIEWMDACILVSTNIGECAHKKFKTGCWTECGEWDEEGNCIDENHWCDNVFEVYVYNLTGCYDNYEKFLDLFFGECGIEPNENGEYDYDPFDMYAWNFPWDCYDTWVEKFKNEYSVSYIIKMKSQIQTWSIIGLDNDIEYNRYCGCPDDYYEASGPCPDDCENVWEPGDWNSCGASATRTDTPLNDPPFSQYYKYIRGGGHFTPEGWYTQDCCDENGARSKIGEAADYAFSYIDNPDVYRNNGTSTKECSHSSDLCFEFEYNSRGDDNSYAWIDQIYYNFRWYTLLLERNSYTPEDAVGVKFKAHLTKTRSNTGADENGGYIEDQNYITEEDHEIILYFDEEYKELPFSKDITRPSYIELPKCNGDCEWEDGEVKIQPYPTGWWGGWQYKHDNWTEYFNWKFTAIEYVKNK